MWTWEEWNHSNRCTLLLTVDCISCCSTTTVDTAVKGVFYEWSTFEFTLHNCGRASIITLIRQRTTTTVSPAIHARLRVGYVQVYIHKIKPAELLWVVKYNIHLSLLHSQDEPYMFIVHKKISPRCRNTRQSPLGRVGRWLTVDRPRYGRASLPYLPVPISDERATKRLSPVLRNKKRKAEQKKKLLEK